MPFVDILTSDNFDKLVQKGLTIVYCWHQTCQPCLSVGPIFEKIEPDYPEIKFLKLNVKEERELKEEFNVRAVPQFLVFYDKQFKGRVMRHGEKTIRESFDQLLDNKGGVSQSDIPEMLRNTEFV